MNTLTITGTSTTFARNPNIVHIIAPVNTDSLTTENKFINPVITLKKRDSPKFLLDARQLSSMIDETKCSWPIELIQIVLTRLKGKFVLKADMNCSYNQMPHDKLSQRLTNFAIAGQQYLLETIVLRYFHRSSRFFIVYEQHIQTTNSSKKNHVF